MSILRCLNRDGPKEVSELSDKLNLSKTTLREHLEDLEEQDLLDHEAISEGRGRPRHAYRLTDRADRLFPSAKDSLAALLYKTLQKTVDPAVRQSILRQTMYDFLQSTNQEIQALLEYYEGKEQANEDPSVPAD